MSKEELAEFGGKIIVGYNKNMGFEITKAEETGFCEMVMEICEKHLNPMGTVHGGAVFGLADTVGGYAIRAMGESACTTCTSSIDFFNPTIGAKKLIGRAQVLKHGRRLSTVEVTIFTEQEKPVAKLIARYCNLDENFKAK